jgi:hypothetical protein
MRRSNRRLLTFAAIGAAALVVGTVAVLAYQSLQVPYQAPVASSPVPAHDCTPAPCAKLQGYTLWVTNLNVQTNPLTMDIRFRNASESTHASPQDLVLIDSQKLESPPVFDAPGCTQWSRHEFYGGATFGPVTVCFRVTSTAPPLVLRWSPDFGFTCCQIDIKLT